jgi:hypothetical protein
MRCILKKLNQTLAILQRKNLKAINSRSSTDEIEHRRSKSDEGRIGDRSSKLDRHRKKC